MSLVDHLREFRYRFLVALAAVVVTTGVALVFQRYLLAAVLWPIHRAVAIFAASRPDDHVEMVTQGITAGFALYFQVAFVVGLIAACPMWSYQLWRFIVPALGAREKRAVRGFLAAAIPLFLGGVAAGYLLCPRGFAVLLSFNPPSVTNLNDVGTFLGFELRLLLIFGLAFQLPVLLVSLNRLGLVTGAMLGRFRAVAVILCGLFAAIATPTTDALTMLALMVPMVAGYLVAEVLCRRHDRGTAAKRLMRPKV
ncbi:MAG: twin-arginine translocase subunit TatC [Propionibacteriaceae bacterium]|jgi:sec-independent protein translocase protein TatC|nr:twin-arginine translocase subunit TatC [Propionibacteriaceae bacterium]